MGVSPACRLLDLQGSFLPAAPLQELEQADTGYSQEACTECWGLFAPAQLGDLSQESLSDGVSVSAAVAEWFMVHTAVFPRTGPGTWSYYRRNLPLLWSLEVPGTS